MNETYDEKRKELLSIDEERETIEKLKIQVRNQSEEMEREATLSMQRLSGSIDYWREDPKLQKIFYEQQEMITTMHQQQTQFQEEFDIQLTRYRKQLNQREEDCRNILQLIEQKEEEKKNGPHY